MRILELLFNSVTSPDMFGANLGLLISYAMAGALLFGVIRGQSRKQRESQHQPEDYEGEDPVAEFEMHSVINTVDATS